jgi:hypothetical protein
VNDVGHVSQRAPPGWHAQSMDAMGVGIATSGGAATPFTSMLRACHPVHRYSECTIQGQIPYDGHVRNVPHGR